MKTETCTTGKSFNLSTTIDHNPFMVSVLPDGRPKIPDSGTFTKDIIFDPVIGRQIFVQETALGPIATVPTVLPHQLVNCVNVTEAYKQTVKKLINHVPTSSAILRDSKVIARYDKDGLFYPAVVQEHVEGNTFVIEFDSNYISSLRMQTTGSFDMIAEDDAMRHCVGEGDFCLAPVDDGYSPLVPGRILFDDHTPDKQFKVQFWHGPVKNIDMDKVCWIPNVLYDRIIAELKSPQARLQTLTMAQAAPTVNHPLDMYLNGTPKYMLQSGLHLPPSVVSRAWCPVSYQGYRYIPTFPVPWLPHFWPEDVNLWPQYLLPFRRTFAAVETNQRLPGIKMSVNELDSKIGGTLKDSTKVIEATSGSYLDRMESFLSRHDNASLTDLIKEDENTDDYEVDITWKIPAKETCDIGENTVVSVKNHLCKRASRSRRVQEDRPAWNKYVRVDEDKHISSVIHSGKYETQIANIHGYKDDDYTLWRLKEKQLKTLEDLHTRKAKFVVNEACRVKEREDDLLNKINQLDKKVQKAERFFIA